MSFRFTTRWSMTTLALMAVACAANSASASVQIGFGANLAGAGSLDSAGIRLNIEKQFQTLAAGLYDVQSFEYESGTAASNNALTPFLAVLTGTDTYTPIWVGSTVAATAAGQFTVNYTPGSEQFTLVAATDVYAGFYQNERIVTFVDPGPSSTTAHDNSSVQFPVVGSQLTGFSHPNLSRNYAFAVTVEAVPEATSVAVWGGLSLLGVVARRRRS